ncbi:MAG TPA: TerC/Alx family metal homeostasis membrane protein [Bacteroidales bacterium]|nr:TerC/Alx family metal homeostasis membrane protein [Bacteroidales bacterium]
MESDSAIWYFVLFTLTVFALLILDLTVIGRKSHVISFRESLLWTAVWVSFALAFYFFLLFHAEKLHGIQSMEHLRQVVRQYAPFLKLPENDFSAALSMYRKNLALEYITGYLIEYSLSVDNIFVILMILTSFSVKEEYYKKVLFWGILGAIVLRSIFIFVGSALIQHFEWILYLFGAFLVYSGIKVFLERNKEQKTEPQNHWLVRWFSSHFRVIKRYVQGNFFVRKENKLFITPLFVVLILIEFTDLIFAFDSIPAIFAVTRDPFIVFFSNIFAIIGLRSLFFLLSRIVSMFHYLKVGIAVLLCFVGVKLLFHTWLEHIGFRTEYSLLFILSVLLLSIMLSVLFPAGKKTVPDSQE